jgi:hypothetical protein
LEARLEREYTTRRCGTSGGRWRCRATPGERSVAIALIDLILRLVWTGSWDLRRPCFERIERELDLPRQIGGSCYDGLLLAARVIEEWPARAHALIAELKVPSLERQLARWWKHLADDVRKTLGDLISA